MKNKHLKLFYHLKWRSQIGAEFCGFLFTALFVTVFFIPQATSGTPTYLNNNQPLTVEKSAGVCFPQHDSKTGSTFETDGLPDLIGFDGTPHGSPHDQWYYDVQESSVYWGDQLHLQFAVWNQSADSVGPFKVRFFISDDASIDDGSDYLLANVVNFSSGLNPWSYGGMNDFGFTITLPSVNPIGGSSPYYIGMVVDYDNEVTESNEGNNKNQGVKKDYDSLTILIPEPDIHVYDSVSPESDLSVHFGDVVDDRAGNAQATETMTIINYGKASLTINQNGISLVDGTHFQIESIVSSTQDYVSLAAGSKVIAANGIETWAVTLSFDPEDTGLLTDTLVITSDDPDEGTVNVSLEGMGIPMPNITIGDLASPETDQTMSFGQVPNDGSGGETAIREITLQNGGSGLLTINQNGISLFAGTNFSIMSVTSDTQGTIVLSSGPATIQEDGQETWAVEILCDPIEHGQLNDSLTISSDDPDEQTVTVTLSAVGLTVQDIQVMDSLEPQDDLTLDFGGQPADGSGNQAGIAMVTITNLGQAVLTIPAQGIGLGTGTNFTIEEIHSDLKGAVNTAIGNTIAGDQGETWTVTVKFDPSSFGPKTDTLAVSSNDPDEGTINAALSGVGLTEPDIIVIDTTEPTGDLSLIFNPTLNDGTGNQTSQKTIDVKNIGTQSLSVSQMAIPAVEYSIVGIVSSLTGAVSLPDTIDPVSGETWTVTISFDPTANGVTAGSLQIQSNDPDENLVNVMLSGEVVQPTIMLTQPAIDLNVNAEQMYAIGWNDAFSAGDARIDLYLDADTDPNNGKTLIVSGLSEDSNDDFYSWHVSPGFEGGRYHVYGVISAGTVEHGSYGPGTLTIDPVNTFRLLSPMQVSNSTYSYEYEFNGQTYGGSATLAPAENRIVVHTPDGGGDTIDHEFIVTFYENTVDGRLYSYDETQQIKTYANGNGIVSSYVYDMLGRLERAEYSTGTVIEYSYDVLGRLTSLHDPRGNTFYRYDNLDRVTSVVTSEDSEKGNSDDREIVYEYNLDGRLKEITYPSGGNVEYIYDPAGRLSEVKDSTGGSTQTTAYRYNATTGFLEETERPNGVKTTYTYDGSARITDIEHRDSSNDLISLYHYEYDPGDRRRELHVTTPDAGNPGSTITRKEKYDYDELDQLIEVVYSEDDIFDANDRIVAYTYDGNGNRLTMTMSENGEVQEDYRYYYGHENRLLQVDEVYTGESTRFYYDPAGNRIMKVTEDETTQYRYDERNLLARVITATQDIEFEYNGAGNRTAKTVNGVRTEYVVDPTSSIVQVLEERDSAGSLISKYTYGIGRISGVLPGDSESTYYLMDGLGSIGQLVEVGGVVTEEYQYDAFGSLNSGPTSPNEYLFTGERFDSETGLVYLRARYYDPEVGAFITKDPLGVSSGMNSYVYVENDPINFVDPYGLLNFVVGFQAMNIDNDDPEEHIDDIQGQMGVGVVLNPGIGESKADLGLYGTVAKGGGLHKGGSFYAGFVRGQSIAGHVNNINLDLVVIGVTVMTDIQTNKFEGFTVSTGPSVGFSVTESKTGDATIREGIDLIQNLFSNPALEAYTPDPNFDYDQLINDIMSYDYTAGDGSLAGDMTRELMGYGPVPDVGGVFIDKAAELIGTNLSDIRGATYDPESGQIVFLGSDDPTAVKDIDMDYFFTAVQAVYGSAVPPFVTMDPPAHMLTQWTDMGDGDGVWEPGEIGGFIMRYNPIWVDEEDDLRVRFRMSWSGVITDFTANIDSFGTGISTGTRHFMALAIENWDGKPGNIEVADNLGLGQIVLPGMGTEDGFALTQIHLSTKEQESYYRFFLQNNGTQNYIMDYVSIIPDKQHRKFGGRVDSTRLGWVMYEADRVMKCLSVGVDNLNGAAYDSTSVPVSDYRNMVEIMQETVLPGGNMRMWFVPNEMTLKRHVDEESGKATIVFDQATVALKTESFLRGLPQSPLASIFADHFNAHYDNFADMDFPVMDPEDPTGETIIQVPIFAMLRDVMQAVSLARFFRDNEIPLDMWWLNSWDPPVAHSPKTVDTAYNEIDGSQWILIHGGVEVNKPNDYVPSDNAEGVGESVTSQRPTALTGSDIAGQAWEVSASPEGALKAVAASMEAIEQDSNIRLAQMDLSFPSPGSHHLTLGRYFDCAFLGKSGMGPGWRIVPLGLEFSRPSWYDEHELMKDQNGDVLWRDSDDNTRLRSGKIRLVNYATGAILDFHSSLGLHYDVDNVGNPVIVVDGLDENNLPSFSPGAWQNGAILEQTEIGRGFRLLMPDGAVLTFDHNGRLLTVTDRHGYVLTYGYDDEERLKTITDMEGQVLSIQYDTDGFVESVTGPYSEEVTYDYDSNGRLTTATHTRSGAATTYAYNDDNQLVSITPHDGITRMTTAPDLRGRSDDVVDEYGNTFDFGFELDSGTMNRTTTIEDVGSATGATWTKSFDSVGRLTSTSDPLGNSRQYGYYSNSLYPNQVQLPTPERAVISIDRNTYGQPTEVMDPEVLSIGGRSTQITYNNANLPVRTIDSAGRITDYTYNDDNDLNKITRYLDEVPVETTFTYLNGYLYTVVDPEGRIVQTIVRDDLGRIASVKDAADITVSYTYDSLGRLETISDPRLSSAIVYTYNDFDQVLTLRTPSGTITYSYYSGTQWLESITDPNGNRQEFVYDSLTGDVVTTRQVVPGGNDVEVEYGYDRLGRLDTITMPEGQSIHYKHDDLGRLIQRSDGDYMTIAITQPDGVDDAAYGRFLIKWVDEDTDSNANLTLYYDIDNTGQDGILITTGIDEDDDGTGDEFSWDLSTLPEGEYYIYAVLDDGEHSPVVAYSEGPVTIATYQASIYLKDGYNMIAIPGDVTAQPDIEDWLPVLGDSTEIEKVMVYDDQADRFVTLIPGSSSNPGFTLTGGEGLIVYAKAEKQIGFTSVNYSTHDLKPGFNLIGFACPPDGYTAFQLLSELGNESVASIQRYSTEKGAFETGGFGPEGQLVGIDFPIVSGEGYFIYMKQEVLGF